MRSRASSSPARTSETPGTSRIAAAATAAASASATRRAASAARFSERSGAPSYAIQPGLGAGSEPRRERPARRGVHDGRRQPARARARPAEGRYLGRGCHPVVRREREDDVVEPDGPVQKGEQPRQRAVETHDLVQDLVAVRTEHVPHAIGRRKAHAEEVRDRVAAQPLGRHGAHRELGHDVVDEWRVVDRVRASDRMREGAAQPGCVRLEGLVIRPHLGIGGGREQPAPLGTDVPADGARGVELSDPRRQLRAIVRRGHERTARDPVGRVCELASQHDRRTILGRHRDHAAPARGLRLEQVADRGADQEPGRPSLAHAARER